MCRETASCQCVMWVVCISMYIYIYIHTYAKVYVYVALMGAVGACLPGYSGFLALRGRS